MPLQLKQAGSALMLMGACYSFPGCTDPYYRAGAYCNAAITFIYHGVRPPFVQNPPHTASHSLYHKSVSRSVDYLDRLCDPLRAAPAKDHLDIGAAWDNV